MSNDTLRNLANFMRARAATISANGKDKSIPSEKIMVMATQIIALSTVADAIDAVLTGEPA